MVGPEEMVPPAKYLLHALGGPGFESIAPTSKGDVAAHIYNPSARVEWRQEDSAAHWPAIQPNQ